QRFECLPIAIHPRGAGLRNTGITERERRIVRRTHRTPKRAETRRCIRPDLVNAFAISATESRLRVSHFLNARRAIDQLLNAADLDVAGSAETLAIARANVVSASCRSRAENAVAES